MCVLVVGVVGCGDASPRPRPPAPFASGATGSPSAPAMPAQPAAPANISTATSDPAWLQCGSMEFPKPVAWTWVKPTAAFRTLQYEVPGGAELIVSVFPAGDGGAVDANIERWANQFGGAGSVKARAERSIGALRMVRVDFEGDFKGMGMAEAKPGMAQLGAIVQGPAHAVFVRLLGPTAAVEASRADFDRLAQGVRPQAAP